MDLGLYLHFPFCRSKCFYCDFNSYPLKNIEEAIPYIRALHQEIILYGKKIRNGILKTIYLGGGTPTLFPAKIIEDTLELCYQCFNISSNIEITIEANPGTLNKKKLRSLKSSGINRISIGAQSFQDSTLKKIGRIHTKADILSTYQIAREVGFKNINLDLIFALPEQTYAEFQQTIMEACALNPDHLSLYSLSLEKGTPLFNWWKEGKINLPSQDDEYFMFKWALKFLKKKGFEHYEISNFALPGKQSQHNQIYWDNQPYLGLGAGASSFLRGYRYKNYSNPKRYILELSKRKFPVEEGERLTLKKRMIETIILGLRKREGISYNSFKSRFKLDLEVIFKTPIEKLVNLKLLKKDQERIKLTHRGLFLANYVFREFLD